MKRCSAFSELTLLASLTCLLLAGTASAQIQGFIDSENATTFNAWNNPTLTIGGWAVSTATIGPAASVQIQIDGKAVGTATPSVARPDVVTYLEGNSAYLNCGWSFTYSAGTSLTPGSHTLRAIASDNVNSGALNFTGTASANINITAPKPPLGYLDAVSPTTATQTQNIVLTGWAGDPQDGSPVKQVQILMDGSAIGNATLGSSRPDVATVYGQTYANSGWSFNYSAAKLTGPHTFTAIAYDKEGLNTTLTVDAQTNTVNVLAPDLVETAVTVVGGPQISGGTIQISDTTTNQGPANAGSSWTRLYLNTTAAKGGTLFGARTISSLTAGQNSSATSTLTLPSDLNGQYFVVACANDTGSVVETATSNDCASASVTIAGAELIESNVTVVGGSQISGGTIQVSDTTTNQGPANAGASWTRFYLNTTPVRGGTLFGTRTISSLTAGQSSSASSAFMLPSNLSGQYYVVVCADDTGSVAETAASCQGSTPFFIAGADLTESSVSTTPAAVVPGGSLTINDTAMDTGASATTSWTRYYLSQTYNLVRGGSGAGVYLGIRTVPALAADGTSSGTVNAKISANTVAGNYYVIACANDTGSVIESNTTNNCSATPLVVYTTANTVFVDQANQDASDASCGTSGIPCKTITEGLSALKTGQTTVLVNPGTYIEQLNITQNVTLASVTKNAAIVQAPSELIPDPALQSSSTSPGQQTVLVNVSGQSAAVNAFILNMTVKGPGPSSCGSIGYGILLANANATIAGNQVQSIRDNPYSGCQNGVAIRFGFGSLGFSGHTGTIAYNTVADYNKGGIVVDGKNTSVSVVGNVVTGQNESAVNGQNGIQISRGATGLVSGNTVSDNLYAKPATPLNMSADGILVYDITGSVTVTGNTVTGNDEGIGVYSDTTAATNVIIQNNTSNNNIVGIHTDMYSSGNTVWLNTAQNNSGYDLADEHANLTFNDWDLSGTSGSYSVVDPKNANAFTTIDVGPFAN